jgi:hypothetical protein
MKPLWGLSFPRFFLGAVSVAWAVGFARYFDRWVYFPAFPNVLDSLGMALVGGFLFWESYRFKSRTR